MKDIFRKYVGYRAESLSVTEGIFLHTDNLRMDSLLKDLNVTWDAAAGDVPALAVQPKILDALVTPKYQGCSHLKYILSKPEEYKIDVTIAQNVIRAYFDTLWNEQSLARNLEFRIFQGSFISRRCRPLFLSCHSV